MKLGKFSFSDIYMFWRFYTPAWKLDSSKRPSFGKYFLEDKKVFAT